MAKNMKVKKIRFQIDKINKFYILGWVVNESDLSEILNCQLKINSSLINFKNDRPRGDLANKGITKGLGGFKIELNQETSINQNSISIKFYEEDIFHKITNFKVSTSMENLELRIKFHEKNLKISNFKDFLISVGVDTAGDKLLSMDCIVETPTRNNRAQLKNKSILKAFSYIGHSTEISNTEIGRYCSIAKGVTIGHGNHPLDWLSSNPFQYQQSFKIKTGLLFDNHEKYQSSLPGLDYSRESQKSLYKPKTIIGNDVWIGTNSIVAAGIKVGDGAVIGAGSIVTKDVPPYAIVAGTPAKLIRYRFSDIDIKNLLNLQWWNYSPWDLHENKIAFHNIKEAIRDLKFLQKTEKIQVYLSETYSIEQLKKIFQKSFFDQKVYYIDNNKFFINSKIPTVKKELFLSKEKKFDEVIVKDFLYEIIGNDINTAFKTNYKKYTNYEADLSSVYIDSQEQVIITEKGIYEPSLYIVPKDKFLININDKKVKRLTGKYILGSNRGYFNYYHLITQCVVVLYKAFEVCQKEDYKILLPNDKKILKFASLLGLDEYVKIMDSRYVYHVDKLKYFSLLSESYIGYQNKSLYLNAFQKIKNITKKDTVIQPEYIYIARLDATKRKMKNENILVERLKELGFTIVSGSTLTLEEQINMFKDVKLIVGQHGAGLTNLVFSNQLKHVVEISTSHYLNDCFFRLVQIKNANYTGIIENIDEKEDRHLLSWECDIDTVISEVHTILIDLKKENSNGE